MELVGVFIVVLDDTYISKDIRFEKFLKQLKIQGIHDIYLIITRQIFKTSRVE